MAAKPSLRFHYPAALRTRAEHILAAIEQDDDPTGQTGALADLVVDLTEAGMDYYFMRAIRQAKLGLVAQKTAQFGMSGSLRLMAPMVRTVLHGANATQLRAIAAHLRQLQGEG